MRLQNFDYGEPGPYFVTICLDDQWHLFGSTDDESVRLNAIGSMIEREWLDLERRYIGLQLDAYAIMPNHFHGILLLPVDETFQPVVSLVEVIGAFKSITTVAYGRGVSSQGWPRYKRRLWQRGYWDHVVRNDKDLLEKRRYVESNPWVWREEKTARP
jgi:REP element-mobilizing transposase RayT